MFSCFAKSFIGFIHLEPWLWKIIITVIVLACSYFLIKGIIALIHVRFFKDVNARRVNFIFLKPLLVILWIIGITYALDVWAGEYQFQKVETTIRSLRNTFILLSILWLSFRWKAQLFVHLINKGKNIKSTDRTSLEFISRILSVVLIFIFALFVMQVWDVPIAPLLAFGGVGAAVIGFASQDMISNFFGSFMIHATRPFSKGEVVDIPEKKLYGTVEEIGWYMSMIRDFDKCPHYIPNSFFTKLYIKNVSRRSHRRIDETIGVRYEDFSKIPNLIKEIYSYLNNHSELDSQLPLYVNFENFGAYSLDIHIRVYTKTPNYDVYINTRHEMLIEIKNMMTKLGADVPFPTTTVHLSKESKD